MSRKFKTAVILILLFAVWIFAAPMLAEHLIVAKPLSQADAILVLGGSSTYIERTQKAAELFKKGIAQKIFLTDDGERAGWYKREEKNPKFVELAQKSLLEQGVPAENIEILEPEVGGTIDEAMRLRETFEQRKFKSILLVTSAYHTRRALWTFEKVFAGTAVEIGIESPPPGIQTPPQFYWWLKPFGWQVVAGEYLKAVYYRVKY